MDVGVLELKVRDDLSQKQRSFLKAAYEIAKTSTSNSRKHGAIIVKSGSVIATGVSKAKNLKKLPPSTITEERHFRSLTVHAEMDALSQLPEGGARGAILYIAQDFKGHPGMSRPCWRCEETISKSGIKKVIYTL